MMLPSTAWSSAFNMFLAQNIRERPPSSFTRMALPWNSTRTGCPKLRSATLQQAPYYMEAEVNSPMIRLKPDASYGMETRWFPVRADKELKAVTAAGVILRALATSLTVEGLQLSGSFGVFFSGRLVAHVFDRRGLEIATADLQPVDPQTPVELQQTVKAPTGAYRVSIHLDDEHGVDCGSLGEAEIRKLAKGS